MSTLLERLRASLSKKNVTAFMLVIRKGEGTFGAEGYRTLVGGGLFDSFDDHPRQVVTINSRGRQIKSSAAGAYQILERTWNSLKPLGLPDFSPASQDLACVALINRRDALDDVIAGRFEAAIRKCNKEWASLPGSPYGQPTTTMERALAIYRSCGGLLEVEDKSQPAAPPAQPAEHQHAGGPAVVTATAGVAEPASPPAPHRAPVEDRPLPPYVEEKPQQETSTMLPVAAFAVNAAKVIAPFVPDLVRLFGTDGSKITERNARAAEVVAQIAVDATGARNAQEAAELVVNDPQARSEVAEQIRARWFEIEESGGGGTQGAREFAERNSDTRFGRVIEIVSYAAMAFLLIANIGVGVATAVAVWTQSEHVSAIMNLSGMVIQADISSAGIAFGFWLGAAWKQGSTDKS
jgi:muramidase (phage lysozyme)